jgi:hypothetical protein
MSFISGNEEWKNNDTITATKLNNLEKVPQKICDAINKMPFMAKRDEQGNLLYSLEEVKEFEGILFQTIEIGSSLKDQQPVVVELCNFTYKNPNKYFLNQVCILPPIDIYAPGYKFYYEIKIKDIVYKSEIEGKDGENASVSGWRFLSQDLELLQLLSNNTETPLTLSLSFSYNRYVSGAKYTAELTQSNTISNLCQAVEDQRYTVTWPEE